MGMFVAPNTAGVMNAVPADRRGVASGMLATFQNSGMTLSIGIFFSLMIAGLSSTLPSTMFAGLTAHGVRRQWRTRSRTCRRSGRCSRRSSGTTR